MVAEGERETALLHLSPKWRAIGPGRLWERWHDEGQGRDVESCAIITTTANSLIGRLHNRMLVILEPDDFRLWLDPEKEAPDKLLPLLHPAEADILAMYPVSSFVNKPQNEGHWCIEPAKEE